MKPRKREALFSMLGAVQVPPPVAFGVAVSVAGTDEWRLVATEPLVFDEKAARARVQALNGGIAAAADALTRLSGVGLADLVHLYRVEPVSLAAPDADPDDDPDEDDRAVAFERRYGPTLRQIEQAVTETGVKYSRAAVMSTALGRIEVLLADPDRTSRAAAERALAALTALGYTGTVQTISGRGANFYEPVLVGPFPLIPGS